MRLAGKCAVVTGAGSGIGRASAIAFAAEGAAVMLGDVAETVFDTAAEIQRAGGRAMALVADVSEERAVADLVARCAGDLGGLDVMLANAGIGGTVAPFVDLKEQDWLDVLRVNLLGSFFCMKHAASYMVDHRVRGAIICTASVAGLRAGGGPAPYSASKAAVINLVRTAACELVDTGIRVNAICPGLIETAMTKPIFDMARTAGKEALIGRLTPLQRAGKPEEIAQLAVMLASEDGSYVNGEVLVADGGLSASLPLIPREAW